MDNILIILTSTITINSYKHYLNQTDPNERLNCYLKSVKQWLEKTSFKICLVENSGYTFPELSDYLIKYNDRFEIITFDELKHPPELQHYIYNCSKGASELFSINYAYNNSKFKETVQFIIKITARYFIESFEEFLKNNNLSTRCNNISISNNNDIIALRQFNRQRCEIVGCNTLLIPIIFNTNMSDIYGLFYPHVEFLYENRINLLNKDNILICDKFCIDPKPMGGIDCIVTDL